jgi:hypothetical protein
MKDLTAFSRGYWGWGNHTREKRPDMPIVMMSGKDLGRPGFPVIKRPFSRQQLAEIVAPLSEA